MIPVLYTVEYLLVSNKYAFIFSEKFSLEKAF